jgi:hypothetical protein
MDDESRRRAGRPWRPWTIWLPAILALLGAAGLIFVDIAGLILGSWDTPSPGLPWLKAGIVGQGVLGAASVGVLLAGLTGPSRRRICVTAAWVIVAAEIAWFLATLRLAGG